MNVRKILKLPPVEDVCFLFTSELVPGAKHALMFSFNSQLRGFYNLSYVGFHDFVYQLSAFRRHLTITNFIRRLKNLI